MGFLPADYNTLGVPVLLCKLLELVPDILTRDKMREATPPRSCHTEEKLRQKKNAC